MQAGTSAQFFDGLTAGRHTVHVALSEDRQALMIHADTLPEPLRWPLQDLRALRDDSDEGRLTLTRHALTDDEAPRDPARLVILDPDLIDWMHRTRPGLFRRDLGKGTWLKIGKFLGGATAATLLMLFVILPAMAGTLARVIPIEREVAFGQTVVRQIEGFLGGSIDNNLRCTDADGLAALNAMMVRLTDGQDMHYDITMHVFDHEMVNAFAAPGGQMVVLRGLLDEADSAEEVAAVLAHEIGHIESRDPTRATLRAAGSAGLLTMILGDVTGGAGIAIVLDHVMNASFSREAEAQADAFAHEMLHAADVDVSAMAVFFDKISDLQAIEIPEYLSSHPVTDGRAALARREAQTQGATRPILSESEWQSLKSICD
ncbi:M48 family metallopeptidase [Tropicibacter naphthalenivorans]|uniref:TPR repeat-containing protein YfgC n=1 Tax=Tropicibacter naphthalenivorans TaxID=441103 RepID=A0A0P1GX60_9RHOB|nr:M48 family metallopeptidase [Tropicibacter naphthalenivorans]CUH78958.1 TPR repeat-containing protein YfgC precursor [Tropicibacter naphthalenivorans]SMD04131.1 Peptidase family M48 [Tropicibacter naphthalenivorans]